MNLSLTPARFHGNPCSRHNGSTLRRRANGRCILCEKEAHDAYVKNHPGFYAASAKRWRKKHPSKVEEYKSKHAEFHARWRSENKGKLAGWASSRLNRYRVAVLAHYGARCACCGLPDGEAFLCVDHVNGDGGRRRKQKKFASSWEEAFKAGMTTEFQILCANCNMSKGTGKKCTLTHRKTTT